MFVGPDDLNCVSVTSGELYKGVTVQANPATCFSVYPLSGNTLTGLIAVTAASARQRRAENRSASKNRNKLLLSRHQPPVDVEEMQKTDDNMDPQLAVAIIITVGAFVAFFAVKRAWKKLFSKPKERKA
ncbi:MAG TPA: hypothetical protein PKW79_02390 [Rhabdochlamydiaceae bacterium]|nr:hypothetical protein [Rhabdochlamydiaceae bacterium]